MKRTVITETKKGHRVWLQGLCSYGWPVGARYHTTYEPDTIVYQLAPEGKRRVAQGKGGIIDTTGKRVTQWAQGADSVAVIYDRENGRIFLSRVA